VKGIIAEMKKKKKRTKIGFIGCGNMGRTILNSIVDAGLIYKGDIYVYDKKAISLRSGCKKARSIADVLARTDLVVLAIKPQNLKEIRAEIANAYNPKSIIVSILAGTTIKKLESIFGKTAKIIRTMPNLGLVVGSGATAVCKNKQVTIAENNFVKKLFSSSGTVVDIAEKHIDVVTAVSGSGPAYYFYLTELLIQEGIRNGLSKKDARILAESTALGSSRLIASSGEGAEVWRRKVTSPGGTTAAALSVLMGKPFQALFQKAIKKAIKRARELSK